MALQNYQAVYGQSLFDICLQLYGSLDFLYKLIQDSGIDSVNVVPFSGQLFIYDDEQVTDQAIINKNVLGNILYATDIGSNGSVYYIIKQSTPRLVRQPQPPGWGIPIKPPPIILPDMAAYGTEYLSNADGVTSFYPLDKDGLSMAGRLITIVQVEIEVKPLAKAQWQWNQAQGLMTLLGGKTLDNNQTAFIIYSIPLSL